MMQVKEEEEYLEWLKGQKQTLSKDKSIAAELVGLPFTTAVFTPVRLTNNFWTNVFHLTDFNLP